MGTLELIPNVPDAAAQVEGFPHALVFGQRHCGNPPCKCHLFIVYHGDRLIVCFPPETIDFDSTGLPPAVLKAFSEAVAAHSAGCYVAAAMLVRKTLECICEDQSASGKNLHDRLVALSSKLVLPNALLDAMFELKALGNDAAHVEAKVYDDIDEDEARLGIGVAKEILKGVYQLQSLVDQLRALKKL